MWHTTGENFNAITDIVSVELHALYVSFERMGPFLWRLNTDSQCNLSPVKGQWPCSTLYNKLIGPSLEIIVTSRSPSSSSLFAFLPPPPPEPALPSQACILQQGSLFSWAFPVAITKPSMSFMEYLNLTLSQRPFLPQEKRRSLNVMSFLKKGKVVVLKSTLN